MRVAATAKAFVLVEIIVVIAILGVLLALLFPAIQAAREASRRSACQSNLRQVGIALQSFEGLHGRFPVGSRSQRMLQNGIVTHGVSWWADILPQLDETAIADALDTTGPFAGWLVMHPNNGRVIDQHIIDVMFCPSSPVPQLYSVAGFRVGMSSYVGISGASNDATFLEKRVNVCCSPKPNGEISAGGMLIPNAAVHRREVSDGSSQTLVVGEASDYCYMRKNGERRRVDAGVPNGWLTGTVALGTPPTYDPTRTPAAYNITTMSHPINTRDYDLPGIDDNRGANNPLVSAHPAGVVALFLDGSVRFLTDDTEVLILKRFATRDDSGVDSHQ